MRLALSLALYAALGPLVALVALVAPGPRQAARDDPEVFASFYPLAYFAERIGGDAVHVTCPVPAGEDPALWRPDRALVARMQEAPLVLVHGASFERWLGQVSLPLARTAVTTRAFAERLRPFAERVVHTHGRAGAASHVGLDPHTWLDPELATEEASAVLAALQRHFPAHADSFAERHSELLSDLESWRVALARLSELVDGELLVASHPSYEYLARSHGWRIANVALDPDAAPDGATLARLRALRADGARLVLWERPPADGVRRSLEAQGLESVVYAPCETLAAESLASGATFLSVMLENVARLRNALQATR